MSSKLLENMKSAMSAAFGDTPDSTLRVQNPLYIQRFLVAYLVVLVGYILAAKLATPIYRTDTDMWYHLNGGRYFWTNGEVPSTTFFSFLEPQREWVNYFWGFQAIIYQIYDLSGYQGLVVFRAIIFTLTVVMIMAYIFSDRKARESPGLFLVLLGLLVVIFEARTLGVRPHIFSYLLIVVFLYILEIRPKLVPLLPVLMVLWVNVHGVEWVISALICGSYLIEYLVTNRKQGKPWREMIDRYSVSIVACAVTLLINPYGLQVIGTSFAHDSDIYLFISELGELNAAVLYSFIFSLAELSFTTAITLLFVLESIGLVLLLKAKRLRVSHTILMVVGSILVFKGIRFVWEWALLSLPFAHAVVKEYVVSYDKPKNLSLKKLFLVGYFIVIPFVNMAPAFGKYAHYPFEKSQLPTGIVSFLNEHDAKGKVLADPVDSGFLEWGLYPNVLIYSDMEFPPFDSAQMYTARWSLLNAEALSRFLDQYTLDFIVVGSDSAAFHKMISDYPQFQLVFLDDRHILYANNETQGELVERYAIKKVDPLKLSSKDLSDEQLIEELERLFHVNPDGRRVMKKLTKALFDLERYPEALVYAERFRDLYPKDPNSHYWLGKIYENTDRCDVATQHYKEALKHSNGSFATTVKNHLGSCAYYQQDFDEAYAWFSGSMNPYLVDEDAPHMYQYAYSTAIVGDLDKANQLIDMLLFKLKPEHEALRANAVQLKENIRGDEMTDLGVASWLRSLVE
jgi:tetratricopeptide (TPR) repeat protein